MTLLAVTLLSAACDKPDILWDDPVPAPQADARAALPAPPALPGMCANTVSTARGVTKNFAAWWRVRPDSSAVLLLASSPDSGRTWGTALSADTTDVSSVGCNRPPPAITAVGDDVYVAYSMIAPEGKGVFFAHTMGSMLHSPVPVIYGERLVTAAIAADAERVAVAYEDPNGRAARIDVALSRSQGHLFEMHTTASRTVDDAVLPTVTLQGNTLTVSWLSRTPAGAAARVVRVGRLQ
jgi:hypothetical protein